MLFIARVLAGILNAPRFLLNKGMRELKEHEVAVLDGFLGALRADWAALLRTQLKEVNYVGRAHEHTEFDVVGSTISLQKRKGLLLVIEREIFIASCPSFECEAIFRDSRGEFKVMFFVYQGVLLDFTIFVYGREVELSSLCLITNRLRMLGDSAARARS